MTIKNPVELAESIFEDVNTVADWYMKKLLFTGPTTTYSVIGVTFYGLGYLGGKWITGAKIGGRIGAAASFKVWRDLQVSSLLYAARHAASIGTVAAVAGTGLVASELEKTLHGNLGMEEIPGSRGGYTHPMGGGDSSYHPFQWFFDLF